MTRTIHSLSGSIGASPVVKRIPATPKPSSFLRALIYVDTILERARWRNQLKYLDDNTLKDLGLSRADVERETARSFWDVRDQH